MRDPSPRPISIANRVELLRLVYRQVIPSSIVLFLGTSALGVSLWDARPPRLLVGCLIGVGIACALRITLALRLRGQLDEPEYVARSERMFRGTLMVTCVIAGLAGLAMMPPGSVPAQALVFLFLVCATSMGAASYAAHRHAVVLVSPLMLPSMVWFLQQPDGIHRALAAGGFLMLVGSIRAARTTAFFVQRSFDLAEELRLAGTRAQELARTDELTGLRNRRAFYEWGSATLEQASRYGRPLSVIVLDLDLFKRINDTHGHAAGDAALRHVSNLLQRTVRATDVSARLGGEEFGIILPETSPMEAMVLAERLRHRLEEAFFVHGSAEIRLTSSFGIAGREGCPTLEVMLERADLALYEAKDAGRNRICLHTAAAPLAAVRA